MKVVVPRRSAPVLPPTSVLPASAAAELSAVFGGVAISGAALYGLAMMIRDANGFDLKDEALMAERMGLETVAPPAPAEDVAETQVMVPDISARVEEARTWILEWKKRSEQQQEEEKQREAEAARVRQEQEAAEARKIQEAEEAERIAKEAEEKALAAKRKIEEKEAQLMAAMAAAKKDVEKRAEEARVWIDAWKEKVSTKETLSANPEMAAAVIKEMTEDTPVGVQKPATPEPVLATAVKESVSDDATAMQSAPVRRVSITTEYENKIKSLISEYESSKEKRRAMMMPKETVTVAMEEVAAAEQEQASRKTNPVIMFFLRIIAMIQACFEYIKSFFSGSQGPHAKAA